MENNNIFDNINLSNKQKQYLEEQKQLSLIIIEIIKRRIELNMTQRDLASISGIKQPMIARIEMMETTPRLDTLLKLTNSLGLNLNISPNKSYEVVYEEKKYNKKRQIQENQM